MDRTDAHEESPHRVPGWGPSPSDASDAFELDEGEATPTPLPREPSRRPGFGRGLWLAGVGGGLWLVVAVLRCTRPVGPPLHVDVREEEASRDDDRSPPPRAAPPAASPPQTAPKPSATSEPTEATEGERPRAVPHPQPATWARDVPPPELVTYTIRFGGTLENVANLFKIYHHEILALNPGIALDKELPPNTRVTVYRREPGAVSQSIGTPSRGSLEGGVPMLPGAGRILKMIPWKGWGTASTVALLDRVLAQWAKRGPKVQPILVGNLSAPHGGKLAPHSTHQSGRDVDLGYLQKLPAGEELNWRVMTADNLDAEETWTLIELLVQTGAVEAIYIDRSVQKLLHEHALASKRMSKRDLAAWMEYPAPTGSGPRPGTREGPLIRHVDGHVDHLHVRFVCLPHEHACHSNAH